MPHPLSLSIPAVSFFFCFCSGLLAGNCPALGAEEAEQSAPGARSPIIGGTAFPSLTHEEDSQAEVWRIRRPDATDKGQDASPSSIYIVPEIRLPQSGHGNRPRPGQPGRERP